MEEWNEQSLDSIETLSNTVEEATAYVEEELNSIAGVGSDGGSIGRAFANNDDAKRARDIFLRESLIPGAKRGVAEGLGSAEYQNLLKERLVTEHASETGFGTRKGSGAAHGALDQLYFSERRSVTDSVHFAIFWGPSEVPPEEDSFSEGSDHAEAVGACKRIRTAMSVWIEVSELGAGA